MTGSDEFAAYAELLDGLDVTTVVAGARVVSYVDSDGEEFVVAMFDGDPTRHAALVDVAKGLVP